MAKPDLYNKTVDLLFEAYRSNTLELSNAYSDVIGTLVAAGLGYKIQSSLQLEHTKGKGSMVWMDNEEIVPYPNLSDGKINGWLGVFYYHGDQTLFIKKECLHGEALKQIMATGYQATELLQILEAFRSHGTGSNEDRIYYGLLKVLDSLGKIHAIADKNLIENNADRFKAHCHNFRPVSNQQNPTVLSIVK